MAVDPAGPALDLEVPLEIVLGTIPLQNVYSSFAAGPAPLPPAPGTLYDATMASAPPPPPMAPQGSAPSQRKSAILCTTLVLRRTLNDNPQ